MPSMSRRTACRAAPSAVRVRDAGTVLVIRHTFRKGREGRPPFPKGRATGLHWTDQCTTCRATVRERRGAAG
ncbi:protein of unknown function [Streptomyces sp. KY75]|nr:protein of unknown function [Streptomyces sp. KY75]CAD5988591.1 protein of unknown function [Streptomyces sp. KY70]